MNCTDALVLAYIPDSTRLLTAAHIKYPFFRPSYSEGAFYCPKGRKGSNLMIFKGRNQVPFGYSRWGYTRGGGKTWHGGIDIVGMDDTTVRMPAYKGKSISGKVVTATIITNHSNLTWEWGWYVCVQLDANQTPDAVNYLYFCHNKKLLVKVGQKVKTGDALAIMGNTGNAAYANPPIEHVHFEVRATRSGRGLDPTAYAEISNAVGIYGEALNPVKPFSGNPCVVKIFSDKGALSSGDIFLLKKYCKEELLLGDDLIKERDGALLVGPVSSGDQVQLQGKANTLKLKCVAADPEPLKVEVVTYSLRVRTGPGTDPYKQVDSVKRGEVFTVLQKYDGWYFIDNDESGIDGWVSGEYVREV